MSFRNHCTVITSSSNFFQLYHSLLIIVLLFTYCIIYLISFPGYVKAIGKNACNNSLFSWSSVKGKGIPHFATLGDSHACLATSCSGRIHDYPCSLATKKSFALIYSINLWTWIRQSEFGIKKKKKKRQTTLEPNLASLGAVA